MNKTNAVCFTKESEATTFRLNKMREKYGDTIFLYKIWDIGNTLKPCDVVGAWLKWKAIAIEFKLLHIDSSKCTYKKVLSKVQWQQIATLENYKRAGGISLLIAYCDKTNDFIIYDYKTWQQVDIEY